MDQIVHKYTKEKVCLLLVILTCLAYLPMSDFAFINYDDNIYVYENPHIQQGITRDSIHWAFTTHRTGNWHPLTWLSLMFDHILFGLNAGGYHLVNFGLHLLNTLLLFIVLNMMSVSIWRSGFVAALFAIHPMHVESVAWVTERKDVLSTLFWMLSMWAYSRYAQRPSWQRMTLVVVFFAFGLMAKPMLVTLPFILLLCDRWPLNRMQLSSSTATPQDGALSSIWVLVLEKWPLFLLAIAASIVTLIVQQKGGNVADMNDIAISTRLLNSLAAYFEYLYKLFWPRNLAVLYPYLQGLPIQQTVAGAVLLGIGGIAAWRSVVTRPYLTVGLLWFFGTLVPVIGIIQVGNHFIADRYTYIPYIGLFIVIVWGMQELFARFMLSTRLLAGISAALLVVLLILCRNQVGFWRDDITLFEHSLAVTKDNFLLHNNLGTALTDSGKTEQAIWHYQQAIDIKPDYETPLNNLGLLNARKGEYAAAIKYYRKALALNPRYATAHYNLANALVKSNEIIAALEHFRTAVEIEPDYEAALYNYALNLAKSGQIAEATKQYRRLIMLNPAIAKAYNDMGNIAAMQNDLDRAIAYYEKALSIDPYYARAYNNLGIAIINMGRINTALMYLEKAVELNPRNKTFQQDFAKAQGLIKQRQ